MNIKDAKQYLRDHANGFRCLQYVEFTDGSWSLKDNQCKLVTREEWIAIRACVDNFMNNASDTEIDNYNHHEDERIQQEIEGMQYSHSPKKERPKKHGYVYFLLADNGLAKIGQTSKVDRRIFQLSVQLPYELKLVTTIESDDCEELEKFYHNKFSEKRVNGEWFNLDSSDFEEVKSIEKQ